MYRSPIEGLLGHIEGVLTVAQLATRLGAPTRVCEATASQAADRGRPGLMRAMVNSPGGYIEYIYIYIHIKNNV